MRRLSSVVAIAALISTVGCTADQLGALVPTGTTRPPVSTTSPQSAVGSALQVRSDAIEAQAKSWNRDAELVRIQGSAINGDGVNFTDGAKWVYTYRSATAAKTVTFTANAQGSFGPTSVADVPGAPAIGKTVFDSDQAVQRYKTSIKDKTLDRFNLTLMVSDGVPTWQILALDSFGTGQGSGAVNASNGAVTVA
ncbi:MAG: hypothetical protein H7338_03760 [Candidatus Sericytochromatia bacterium]|nr:hypothetical protein [Candidatus Sericytochromatia bacterium]